MTAKPAAAIKAEHATPARPARTPPEGVTVAEAPRPKSDSVGDAFEKAIGAPSEAPKPPGVSTQRDIEAVRKVFNEVSVNHVAQVRDVMLELRFGEADPAWMESTRPALRSLHAMASQMDLTDLCKALDDFCSTVDAAVQNRAKITDEDKGQLLERYQRLIELIPQAFELDAERDRREPIIVEALLYQVDGVEKLVIDKLFAVGLNRLDALMNANADEMVAVSGISPQIAAAIVAKFKSYRMSKPASVSVRDATAERRELADLLTRLSVQNADFERLSNTWTDEGRTRKRELRKQREQTFQQIKVTLARLGERDRVTQLEKLPFTERIATLDRYLSAARQT